MQRVVLILAACLALAAPATAATRADCQIDTPSARMAPPAVRETIAGRTTLRYLPKRPRGVVYMFHGTGGSETFAQRTHSQRVIAELTAAGYGYLAAPSLDRSKSRRWDLSSADPATNPDLAYMLAIHEALITKGDIARDTPVFTMGMSNGGGFANLFGAVAKAQGLPVRAVADYMGPFPAALRDAVRQGGAANLPPTLLILSRNDGLVSSEQTDSVAQRLKREGARIEVHLNEEKRICPATFALVAGLNADGRSRMVTTILPAAGITDPAGDRILFRDRPAIGREEVTELRLRLADIPEARAIEEALLIAWAGHQMRSDYARRQVEYFDAALRAGR